MQFTKIIGKIDDAIIKEAEKILTKVFIELGSSYTSSFGTKLGGDALIFALVVPSQHIATLNVQTAATDGKRFFWNPYYIVKKGLLGTRALSYHESTHALYMHPQRVGKRNLELWNIAVDYLANGMYYEDLLIRLKNEAQAKEKFIESLSNFCTIDQAKSTFTNPKIPIPGMESWKPEPLDPKLLKKILPAPDSEIQLTEEQREKIIKKHQTYNYFYMDPKLTEEMKRPEKIYDILYESCPKCPECGRVGTYFEGDDGKANITAPTADIPAGYECSTCPKGYDVLDFGSTVDQHMMSTETQQEIHKRISDAIATANQMAGKVPGSLEIELGILSQPKIRWQDYIRFVKSKIKSGNSKNNWTQFKTRAMFAGILTPKRISYSAKFICLLDTSGSMFSDNQKALGVSQLAALDDRAEGIVVPGDCEIYWKDATKLNKCNASELLKIKVVGGGSTMFADFFKSYKDKLGVADFIVVITDGHLDSADVSSMKNPGVQVIWLITSNSGFKPPFGKVFDLRDS